MDKYLGLLLAIIIASSSIVEGAKRNQELHEGNFCQGCRSLVSFASRFNSSSNRAANKAVFVNFCEQYYPVSTDFQQGPCPMFAESLFYIIERVDPVNHCDQIGACGQVKQSSVDSIFYQLLAPSRNTVPAESENDNGIVCTTCEQIVEQVQNQLKNPDYIESMHKTIDALCQYLQVVEADKECKQLLTKYFDDTITFIQNLKPEQYCQSIKLCPRKESRSLTFVSEKQQQLPSLVDFRHFGIEVSVEKDGKAVKDLRSPKSVAVTEKSGTVCMLCKVIIKEMFRFLKDNRTEGNIRDGLDKVCGLVFRKGPKFNQCEQLVATYSEELISILADETDPELVCMLLEQCTHFGVPPPPSPASRPPLFHVANSATSSSVKKLAAPISLGQFISMLDSSVEVGSMKTCVECRLFVKYVQDSFGDVKSQEEMKNWLLNNLCGSLDNEKKESCVELVDNYSEAFFKAVAEQLNPTTVCTELKACHPEMLGPLIIKNYLPINFGARKQQALEQNKVIESLLPPTMDAAVQQLASFVGARKDSVCDECVLIITHIDEYLSTHSVDDDVTILIDQVCNKFSGSAKEQCTVLIKELGETIIKDIAAMDNPHQFCHSVTLC